MAFKYTQAEFLTRGEKLTSRKFGSQARARNSRMRHGPANTAWRFHFWNFNFGRLARCPEGVDGCGTAFPVAGIGAQWPAMGEWQEFYIHLTQKNRDLGWADAPPGEEGGVNPATPIGAYVHGVEGILAEADRLSCNPLVSLEEECPQGVPTLLPGLKQPQTLEEFWQLGAMQRGGIDFASGVSGARMLDTAVSYWAILAGFTDLHHKCFGGYVPQPLGTGEDCLNATPDSPASLNLQIFYTPLKPGLPVRTFEGTCPPIEGNPRPKHIRFRAETPRSYYIVLNDGTTIILSKKDYIEGPYKGGGVYTKLDGGQLLRAMNAYLSEFRGSDEQRESPEFNRNIARTGMPFRKLATAQYFGAPNYATFEAGSGQLLIDLPLFRKQGSSLTPPNLTVPAGTAIGGSYANHANFVTGGLWAKGTKLAQPVTVRMLNGSREIYRFTLVPGKADPVQPSALAAGEAQHLKFFEQAENCQPVRFELVTDLVFADATGDLSIETNDVWKYLPEGDDLFLLMRLIVAQADEGRIGNEVPDANDLWDAWREYGCVVSGGLLAAERAPGTIGTYEFISDNKMYETMRRLVRKNTRLYNREQILAYEVAGGKSVLYVRRTNRGLDQMDGLAPSLEPVAAGDAGLGAGLGLGLEEGIFAGVKYWVRGSGTVTYNGHTYSGVESGLTGPHFTGVNGQRGYTYTGSARVFEYEGILHPDGVFKPKQWSNEWVMWAESKPYSYEGPDGPINRLHPSLMADFYAYFNGCHFYSTEFETPGPRSALGAKMFYSQERVIMSEAPDGYNFVEGANAQGTPGFVRACQVMKPPPEIDSAVSYLDLAVGQEVVKLTFRGRFDTLPEAPASVPVDRSLWEGLGITASLRAQGPRTMENAIMEYLLALDRTAGDIGGEFSTYRCTVKEGDWAANGVGRGFEFGASPRDEFGNNVFGNCIPHFFAVRLAQEPPEDGDDNYDVLSDANGLVEQLLDWEMRDRAMAPGYVDDATSIAVCDDRTNLMDFTYANLNVKAHGDRWIPMLPSSLLFRGRQEGRADLPEGHGPMVRNIMADGSGRVLDAETWNRFAANVNLLTKVRLMVGNLGATTQARVGSITEQIGQSWGDDCGLGSQAVFKGVGFSSPPLVEEEVLPCGISGEGYCIVSAAASVKVTSQGDDGTLLTGCSSSGSASLWRKVSSESRMRWNIQQQFDIGNGVHPEVQGLIAQGSVFVIGIYSEERSVTHAVEVKKEEEADTCGNGRDFFSNEPFFRDGTGYKAQDEVVTQISECRTFPLSGELSCDGVGGGDSMVCIGGTSTNETGLFEGGAGLAAEMQKTIAFTANSVAFVQVPLEPYVRERY